MNQTIGPRPCDRSRLSFILHPSSFILLFKGGLFGAALALLAEAVNVLLGPNLHEVLPGAVYRCAQPSPAGLESIIRRHGIRTIINLRGCCEPASWYLDECRVASRCGVSFEDVSCSAGRLPSVQAVRELVAILDRTEYPVLIHCHKGIDRTGMTSAIAVLLYTDDGLPAARAELGLRHGHLAFGRTANIDRFFDLYEEWLAAEGLGHSRSVFRRWLLEGYCPGECRARLEVLQPQGRPLRAEPGVPLTVRIRAHNTSVKPWQMHPGNTAGIHCQYVLVEDGRFAGDGRAGLFEALVPPGGSVDLALTLPALHRPGRYELRADLVDEQHAVFMQEGSEPLLLEVEVP
jgi:protein tyrosine phosphatase (PTP) superfamily phosphohydrolase (DUF442 family)